MSDQDLTGARFDRADIRDVTVTASDLHGLRVRGSLLRDSRLTGVELSDVEITGELRDVTVNGVDIGPLVEAELDRRQPDRVKMRPDDPAGFRAAYALLEGLWAETVERARTLPAAALHESVDGEWSFTQTLRHLNFATACWVGRMILGDPKPWHPLDLPWDEAPGWDGIPWDRDATPPLDEVLAVRRERQAMVRGVLESLTDDQLAARITRTDPGWPQETDFPVKQCLRIVLNEEWEHRRYTERDLTALLTAL